MITKSVSSQFHSEMVDITQLVEDSIPEDYSGVITLYTPHTTAALAINEGADPDVRTDILTHLEKMVPSQPGYFKHAEGNSAAHIKALLVGNSCQVLVESGILLLGTWEKIFFLEFDGPRTRKLWLNLVNN